MARKKRARGKTTGKDSVGVSLGRLRLRLQGWYLRTLRVNTTGDYGKLKHMLEFFLRQAERALGTPLWERTAEVAVEEALLHLALRWGPVFRQPLHLEARVTDTHLKFSLTVPPDALAGRKGKAGGRQRQRREEAAERSLYVVKRLSNRLHVGPAGRQLVFWLLLRRASPF